MDSYPYTGNCAEFRLPDGPGSGSLLYARGAMLAAHMANPAGRTFIYWLAQACKRAREVVGLKQADIQGLKQGRVSRFETGTTWPDNPELVVQAYAQTLGIKDSRYLWNLALDMWIEHGQPPPRVPAPKTPAIPEGELLRRLREGLPSDGDRRPPKNPAVAG